MDWPVPDAEALDAVARGVHRQWRTLSGDQEAPRILKILGFHSGWLLGFLRARALAPASERSRDFFSHFEAEACAFFACKPVAWPRTFDRPGQHKSPATLDLPQLDPRQALLLTAGFKREDPALKDVFAVLLDRAFGGHAPRPGAQPIAGEQRIRLCSLGLTDSLRQRWSSGLGLEPPALFTHVTQASAKRLLAASLARTSYPRATGIDAPELDMIAALGPATAVDLLLTALVTRACLRTSDIWESDAQQIRAA